MSLLDECIGALLFTKELSLHIIDIHTLHCEIWFVLVKSSISGQIRYLVLFSLMLTIATTAPTPSDVVAPPTNSLTIATYERSSLLKMGGNLLSPEMNVLSIIFCGVPSFLNLINQSVTVLFYYTLWGVLPESDMLSNIKNILMFFEFLFFYKKVIGPSLAIQKEHARKINGLVYQNCKQNPVDFMANPFQSPAVVSCSLGGVGVPYWWFLIKAKKGTIFFQAAGNDLRTIKSSYYSENQANSNVVSRNLARFCETVGFFGCMEGAFNSHPNVVHCGVVSRDELGLETYSNYPAEDSSLHFLTIALPEGFTGTSFAAPIIAGIFCKLKSMYPQIPNRELINLMYETAKYIGNGNATRALALFHGEELSRIQRTENHTISMTQASLDRLIAVLRERYTPDASSRCEHERLIHRFTNSGNQFDVMGPLIGQIYDHNWGNHFTPQGILKPPFYIVNREQLFTEAERRWGTVTEQTAHNTVSQAA